MMIEEGEPLFFLFSDEPFAKGVGAVMREWIGAKVL